MRFDAAAFGRRVAQTIKEHVAPVRAAQTALEQSTAALVQRIDTLERSLAAATVRSARIDRSGVLFITLGDGRVEDVGPVVGRDADPAQVTALVETTVADKLKSIETPRVVPASAADLRPVMTEVAEAVLEPRLAALQRSMPAPSAPAPTPEALRPLVAELVDAAVAARPAPQLGAPGRDADPAQVKALVETTVADKLKSIETPRPVPPAPETLRPLVAELVDAAVAAMPKPQPGAPGRDADPTQVQALVEDTVARQFATIDKAADGRGIAALLIDDAGELVVTLTDGAVIKAGRVKGRDGADIDGIRLASEDGRTFTLELTAAGGRVLKAAPVVFAGLVDRGVWRAQAYTSGDGVTFKGSYWIAERPTDARPGDPASGWRLAIKRGRDGRPDRAPRRKLEESDA